MPSPVVAGVDGSAESLAAAEWAAREALRRGLPLRLVHAWEGLPEDEGAARLPELRAPRAHASRVLRATAGRTGERYPQASVTTELLGRQPVPALLAEAENAELLVVGSQGLGGIGGFVAGSVALGTVAHARRPVVLVRAGEGPKDEHLPGEADTSPAGAGHRDVAVGVDIAGNCDAVLEFAFHAALVRRAPLRVVHSWHMPLTAGVAGAAERARVRQRTEQRLDILLEPWHRKFPTVFVKENLYEGHPAHVLVRAAGGAGLLVVGRRRSHPAVGVHTGPVVRAAVRHAGCPVALVAHD
jgi:nucleotide-binding universal stress UspA family protein